MVTLDTLNEPCILVLTLVYCLLFSSLGWPPGLLSSMEQRSGTWKKLATMRETTQATHVERPCGGACGPHGGALPLRRNFIYISRECSKQRAASRSSIRLCSEFNLRLCFPLSAPGQWMNRVGCQGLAIMTVFAAEPHFGLTEAGLDQHWSPKLSLPPPIFKSQICIMVWSHSVQLGLLLLSFIGITSPLPKKLLAILTSSQNLPPRWHNWHRNWDTSQQQEPMTQAGDAHRVTPANPQPFKPLQLMPHRAMTSHLCQALPKWQNPGWIINTVVWEL